MTDFSWCIRHSARVCVCVCVKMGHRPSRGRDGLVAARAGGSLAARSLGFVQLFTSLIRVKSLSDLAAGTIGLAEPENL